MSGKDHEVVSILSKHSMRLPARLVLVLAALVASMALSAVPSQGAGDLGRVRGEIIQSNGETPTVKLAWFAADWTYLGARRIIGRAYSLALKPGTYFLQFTDQRPSYDVTKSAPTTVKVTIRAAATTSKTIRMRRGASLGLHR